MASWLAAAKHQPRKASFSGNVAAKKSSALAGLSRLRKARGSSSNQQRRKKVSGMRRIKKYRRKRQSAAAATQRGGEMIMAKSVGGAFESGMQKIIWRKLAAWQSAKAAARVEAAKTENVNLITLSLFLA